MPLDFPNSPTTNQIWVAPTGVAYTWDGTKWGLSSSSGAVGGPYLPTIGGTVTGVTTFLAGINIGTAQVSVTTPTGAAIQAAINALPATGGMVTLLPNTTYVATAAIVSSTPNVHIWAPSWNTVIQRAPSLTPGIMLSLTGSGCLIEGMTFDGNNVASTGGSEVAINGGANCRITNCQVINSASPINIMVACPNGRVDHCTIIGRSLNTDQAYGVWGNSHVPVCVDHNTITGTGTPGIGVDGPGTIVSENYVSSCHWYTGISGGQILIDNTGGSASDTGITVANNYIGTGGASGAGGIELQGVNITVTGNTIVNMMGGGTIIHSGSGLVFTGNSIVNVGLNMNGSIDGLTIGAGVTDFVICGNRIGDTNPTPNMRFPVTINTGASDRYVIAGNLLGPASWGQGGVTDNGTGMNKVINNNVGTNNYVPTVNVAASIFIPPTGVLVMLNGSGTITNITPAAAPIGRTVTFIPLAPTTSFTTGGNISPALTTTQGVPVIATFDGSLWRIK